MTGDDARYHTFWPRVAAAIIDGLVLLPLALTSPDLYSLENSALIIVMDAINYFVPIAYSVYLHARYGQTFGKMAVRVRVMDASESRLPSLRQAFVRDIGEIVFNVAMFAHLAGLAAAGGHSSSEDYLSTFWDVLAWAGVAWALLELGTMLTNRKRRALHDYIAGTVVIKVPRD